MNCKLYHDSCSRALLDKLINGTKYSLRLYILTQLAPAIVMKFKDFKANPLKFLKIMAKKIMKSMLFFCGYLIIDRVLLCTESKFQFFNDLNNLRFQVTLNNIIACFAILFESSERILDLNLFTFPRAFEGWYILLKKLTVLPDFKYADKLIFAISIGAFSFLINHYKEFVPESYQKAFNFIMNKGMLKSSNHEVKSDDK